MGVAVVVDRTAGFVTRLSFQGAAGVLQIIKKDGDAVAVDPGGANAEAIVGIAGGPIGWIEIQGTGLAIETDGNSAVAPGSLRVVNERPVVLGAIRVTVSTASRWAK